MPDYRQCPRCSEQGLSVWVVAISGTAFPAKCRFCKEMFAVSVGYRAVAFFIMSFWGILAAAAFVLRYWVTGIIFSGLSYLLTVAIVSRGKLVVVPDKKYEQSKRELLFLILLAVVGIVGIMTMRQR